MSITRAFAFPAARAAYASRAFTTTSVAHKTLTDSVKETADAVGHLPSLPLAFNRPPFPPTRSSRLTPGEQKGRTDSRFRPWKGRGGRRVRQKDCLYVPPPPSHLAPDTANGSGQDPFQGRRARRG